MSTKTITISSLGLKNVVLNKYHDEEDFIFILGEQKFQMKSIFAEFISPVVSRLHQSDPTINQINFGELNTTTNNEMNKLSKTILTKETISLLLQISSGFSIEINEEQAIKLQFLSILLGNEELYGKLSELFPQKYKKENINLYLKNIECFYHFSRFHPDFDFTSLLSFICSHFDQLNKEEFLKLPRRMQLQIISHPDFQIESEDSLFDIVFEIIERNEETEEIDNSSFLEQIEFTGLSEDKLRTFVDVFDVNEMNNSLWLKISKCFFGRSVKISKRRCKSACKPSVIVCGFNRYNQFNKKANNKDKDGYPIICPPLEIEFDSEILSYSVYGDHAVLVKSDGSLLGIGMNKDGRISNSLTKSEIRQFTKFSITGENRVELFATSVVCCLFSTLYILSKSTGNGNQLVYCDAEINGGNPIFLDIGDKQPVALFGGRDNAAAISSDGDVMFIYRHAVKNSPNARIPVASLPNGEKASSVAFSDDFVFVLSSKGRVFSSKIERKNITLNFSEVKELADEKIICLSGLYNHCIAVNEKNHVFVFGSNHQGQLGLNENTKSVPFFIENSSLRGLGIKEAYAGNSHSLFVDGNGKIFSCGWNNHGELLYNIIENGKCYSPIETTVTGSTFCIAGAWLSVAFIGSEIPPYMPNMPI